MAAGVYETVMPATAVTAQKTLIEIVNPDDVAVEILRVEIGQENLTADEIWTAIWQTYSATGTGTAGTIYPSRSKDGTHPNPVTSKYNMTVEGSGAALYKTFAPFHIKNGLLWVATPHETLILPGSAVHGLKLTKTPSASATTTAIVVWKYS